MKNQDSEYSFWKAFRYSIAMIPDNVAYQTFTFCVFAFYYSVLGANVWFVSLGFVIWAIWNAFNDPMMGYISDRTKTRPRVGRRKFWVIIAYIPLAAVMILLFTPPNSDPWTYVYFLVIICIFELVYTTYSLNQISMFPEIFLLEKERVKANNLRQIIAILGLIIAFVTPTFIIGDLTDAANRHKFIWVGYIAAGVIFVIVTIFLIVVPKERKEFSHDYKANPGFFASLKFSLKNKAFWFYLPTNLSIWYVYGILPSIIPFFGRFILNLGKDSIWLGVLLALGFVTAAFSMPFWAWLSNKNGPRISWIISIIAWIAALSPVMFITKLWMGFVTFGLMGFGMAGSLFNKDIIFGQIIDYDELTTGVRREASYFGIDNFFSRLATVLVSVSIGAVFGNDAVGWTIFDPASVTNTTRFGIKILMFILPAIALTIGAIFMAFYPLHGKKLDDLNEKLKVLHEKKIDDNRIN